MTTISHRCWNPPPSQSTNPQWGECFVVQLASTANTTLSVELVTQAGEILGSGSCDINPHISGKYGGTVIREISILLSGGRARGTLHLLLKRHVLEPFFIESKTKMSRDSEKPLVDGSVNPASFPGSSVRSASAPVDEVSSHVQAQNIQGRSVSMDKRLQLPRHEDNSAISRANHHFFQEGVERILRRRLPEPNTVKPLYHHFLTECTCWQDFMNAWHRGDEGSTCDTLSNSRASGTGGALVKAGFERVKLLVMLPRRDIDNNEILTC